MFPRRPFNRHAPGSSRFWWRASRAQIAESFAVRFDAARTDPVLRARLFGVLRSVIARARRGLAGGPGVARHAAKVVAAVEEGAARAGMPDFRLLSLETQVMLDLHALGV